MPNDPIDRLRRTAYPNPERIGCPDPAIFEALRRRKIAFDDPVWAHIEHCSPFYCQFAEIRDALFVEERSRDTRKVMRTVLVFIALLALGGGLYIWKKRRGGGGESVIAVNRGEAAVLNLEDESELRGGGDKKPATSPDRTHSGVQHLPRNQLNLTVYLPLGSPDGIYQLELVSPNGQTVWHVEGRASIRDGLTSLPVNGDLRNVPIGEYKFRFRRPGETWHEKDVVVR